MSTRDRLQEVQSSLQRGECADPSSPPEAERPPSSGNETILFLQAISDAQLRIRTIEAEVFKLRQLCLTSAERDLDYTRAETVTGARELMEAINTALDSAEATVSALEIRAATVPPSAQRNGADPPAYVTDTRKTAAAGVREKLNLARGRYLAARNDADQHHARREARAARAAPPAGATLDPHNIGSNRFRAQDRTRPRADIRVLDGDRGVTGQRSATMGGQALLEEARAGMIEASFGMSSSDAVRLLQAESADPGDLSNKKSRSIRARTEAEVQGRELDDLERNVVVLNQMFTDLRSAVACQGSSVQVIGENVSHAAEGSDGVMETLESAAVKVRTRKRRLLVIVIMVAMGVAVAIAVTVAPLMVFA